MHKLTKSQLNLPGVCLRCNTSENREWFLDTDIYLDFIGNAYICNMCCIDIINAAGGLSEASVESLERLHSETLTELETNYSQEIQELRGIQAIAGMTLTEIVEAFTGFETRIDEIEREQRELPVGVSVDPEPTDDDPVDEPDGDGESTDQPINDPEFALAVADGVVNGLELRFGL